MTTERETWAMTLDVTQAIIDRSTCGSATACAIAEAIRVEVRGSYCVSVDKGLMGFNHADSLWTANTPETIRQFIEDFDLGKDNVHPAKFEVTFEKY